MYNVGLGDCFLLRFKTPGRERDRFMLIDCGLFRGSDSEKATLQAVAEDIAKTTKGRLDVVVATHEHQDHLSGFVYAADIFREKIKIDKVWRAWTERPSDLMAQQLKGRVNVFNNALNQTVARLKLDREAGQQDTSHPNNPRRFSLDALEAVGSVMDFIGLDGSDSLCQRALRFLDSSVASPDDLIYHEPGTVTTIDGVPNIKVYILGPPRSANIKKSDPSRKNSEVYNFGTTDQSDYAMLLPAWTGDEDEDPKQLLERIPFDSLHYTPLGKLTTQPLEQETQDELQWKTFFRDYYLNDINPNTGQSQKHRRIDDDWLFALGNLALQLDGDTNNTSLVMAIELTDSGKVLLFPGDAQVGNWLSWEKCEWKGIDGLTTEKLLERTVFYKVGHHGSHNATLRDKGLERMQSPDLVAMIPLDQDFAHRKDWDMPFTGLYNRLAEKTKGRILQSDQKLNPAALRAAELLTDEEKRTYETAVTHSKARRPSTKGIDRPLWTEFIIR